MFYDASSRRQEMEDLEFRYGKEADKAMEWAASLAMEHDICESFLPQLEASPLSS
jgi:hypothetical protein